MRKLCLVCLIAVSGIALNLTSESFPNPCGNGALQPNWSVDPRGGSVLSWIEPSKTGLLDLRYAVRRGAAWSEPRTVATNRHFFRHPAELPEVMQFSDTMWLAHWVEVPQESSDAEFIYVSSSSDGVHWSQPLMANQDRKPVEHGLVSMIESGKNEASLFWLETPKGEDGPGYLMHTVVNAQGKETKEEPIDTDVCSCCSTAVARTAKGLLVAYRDHTNSDIRDISVTRLENDKWSKPNNVHADNWKLDACPINGPGVAAKDNRVAVVWYTGAQDSPRTQIAFSNDSGSTFANSVVVSTGHSQGFPSVILDENGGAIVSWLEQGKDATRLLVRSVDAAGVLGQVLQVATGTKTSLGYPRLVRAGGASLIAWGSSSSKILTATLRP
jgi:hypothetical protein